MGCLLGGSGVGLMTASSKGSLPHGVPLRCAGARVPVPVAGHFWPMLPQETCKHSKAALPYLCGISGSWCTKDYLSPSGYRVFILKAISPHPHHLVGAYPLALDMGYLLFVVSNILLSMVLQQGLAILEFLQKMSTHPSTLLSWTLLLYIFKLNNLF